ncbi:PEP-CTERM sorting domain-containing protein [Undibacterium sp. TJN25]|uniref:PEP-CTERM sorting domain-containing protein n=1 Tax=Undibacterium sp. TJN25 TaxID=3413056 RepID=UPI003BF275C2
MLQNLSRLFLVGAFAVAGSSQATVIDFNVNKTYHASGSYQEDGFQISATDNGANKDQTLVFWGNIAAGYNADHAGNTLTNNYAGATLVLSKSDGSNFSFGSIDITDGTNSNATGNVIFNFLFGDGSTSQSTVALDNNIGLQTFVFNLTNLSAVSWTPLTTIAKRAQVDNIVLDTVPQNTVPEPATAALFGLGLLGVGVASRKSKSIISQ